MKTILAGILLLVVVANADKPCQVPERFVSHIFSLLYNINAQSLGVPTDVKLYYDANNKRIRVEGQNEGNDYTVIILYQEEKQYVVSGGHCFVMPSKGQFQDMSIQANATLLHAGRIGTASDGLDINVYGAQRYGGGGVGTFTQENCLMTSFVILAKNEGANSISYGSLTDVSLDYDDSVFNKPAGCHELPGPRARRAVGGIWENLQGLINPI